MHLDDALRQIAHEAEREAGKFRRFAQWSEPHASLGDAQSLQAETYARLAALWTERADAAKGGHLLTNAQDPAGWTETIQGCLDLARQHGRVVDLALAE